MSLILATVAIAMLVPSSQEVTFTGQGGMKLVGTLEMPENASKSCPAMVLLPGSGPTDRDGNSPLLNAKVDLLKEIADRLASEGIATLRFDKRAIMRYASTWPKSLPEMNEFFGWEQFVGDAHGAYSFLRMQKGIDPKRVGILGHSEGSMLTIQLAHDLANSAEKPKAIVLLGAPGRPLGPVVHEQLVRQFQLAKFPEEKAKALIDFSDKASEALKEGKPLPGTPPSELAALYNPSALKILGAYFRNDPIALGPVYSGPVFIANGADDTQVSAERDTPLLKAAFAKRKTGGAEVLIVPKASHNFKSTADGNMDAFGGPVMPELLNGIAGFLKRKL